MNHLPDAAAANTALDDIARLIEAGNWQEARTRCEELVASSPGDADALAWLGQIAVGQFRWEDAIVIFDQVMRLRVDPWTLGNLGVCQWKVGNLEEAEYCLRGAVEIKPDFTRAHVSLADALTRTVRPRAPFHSHRRPSRRRRSSCR